MSISTFNPVAWRPVNFRKLSVPLSDILLASGSFLCGQKTYHQLPSTFREEENFRQLS